MLREDKRACLIGLNSGRELEHLLNNFENIKMSFNALLAMEYFSTVAHMYHIDDMPGVISGCILIMGDQVEDLFLQTF